MMMNNMLTYIVASLRGLLLQFEERRSSSQWSQRHSLAGKEYHGYTQLWIMVMMCLCLEDDNSD